MSNIIFRTKEEKELGHQQHLWLKKRIKELWPELRSGQHDYIQNKISQKLRRCKCDIIQVWINDKPFNSCQYEKSYHFKVGETTSVYMNIQVD